MCKCFAEPCDMSDVELFDAPFREDILSEMSIHIIIFDQKEFNYRRTQC